MIKNSVRKKQKRQEELQRKRERARWLLGLMDFVVVDADGTHRIVEGEEAVEAILRQWERDEAEK